MMLVEKGEGESMRIIYVFLLMAAFLMIQPSLAAAQDKKRAKMKIFTNANIYLDSVRNAKNIAVKNGNVCALNVDPAKFKHAEVIDLKGGAVYPGFHDSHVHLVEAGWGFGGVDLQNTSTSDQIAKKVAAFVKTLPKGAPFTGVGFSPNDYDAWSAEDLAKLDKASENHPAFLIDKLGHNCLINSASIKLCKITAKTKVPMGGKIIIKNGKPTGMLRESAMTIAFEKLIPLFGDKQIKKGALEMFKMWASMGYTSIVDLMGAPFGRIIKPGLCMELEKAGKLPLRVNYQYTFFSLDEMDGALEYLGKDSDMVRFGGLKLFVDGAYAGGQAWTKKKNKKGDHGLFYVYTDDSYGKEYNIYRIVEKVNRMGLNIHYHVQGDMAIGAVLDALEKEIKKTGYLTSTHTLIHLAFPTHEQVKRMKKLAPYVKATVQPAFWQAEEGTDKYYGDRAKSAYPVKALFDAGVVTGISTDFSVSPLELSAPSKIMNLSLTGAGDPAHHKPLKIQEVIQGLTEGSAATSPRRDVGKLKVGYKADFVVYEKDLLSVDPKKFSKDYPKVLSTWVGGRKVYQAK
jgi:predicted amidohydrolase YtcJ